MKFAIVTTIAAIVPTLWSGATALAQTRDDVGQIPNATFRSDVDLVALTVAVTDQKHTFVPGLAADDFVVTEDGVRQTVSFVAGNDVPLDLAIVLDSSASMAEQMTTVRKAAIGFARAIRPGDRVLVVDIKHGAKVLHPLDADPDDAPEAIQKTVAQGDTALYSALYITLKEMARQRGPDIRRQAIAVLSDGEDTASALAFEDVIAVARASGAAIYTITVQPRPSPGRNADEWRFSGASQRMKDLARETGARSFFAPEIVDLPAIYAAVTDDLAGQYVLGYVSSNPARDGKYRHVVVSLPNHPGARTRTRPGYDPGRGDNAAINRRE